MIELTIPALPPSTNHYLKRSKFGTYLSQEAKDYRVLVKRAAAAIKWVRIDGAVRIDAIFYGSPSGKKTEADVSNYFKSLEDALAKCGFFENDKQVSEHHCYRGSVCDQIGGRVVVRMYPSFDSFDEFPEHCLHPAA